MFNKYYFMGYSYILKDVSFLIEKVCGFSDKTLATESEVSQAIDAISKLDSSLYAKFAKEMHKLRFSSLDK